MSDIAILCTFDLAISILRDIDRWNLLKNIVGRCRVIIDSPVALSKTVSDGFSLDYF